MFQVRWGCPLNFVDRVVYSLLAHRSRYQRETGVMTVWRYTGQDRESVRSALGRLEAHGLVVEKAEGCWYALCPASEKESWFIWPAKLADAKDWSLRPAYDKLYLPAPKCPLNIRMAAVYSVRAKCGGMVQGIARRLGLDRATVRGMLKKLQAMGTLPDTYFQEAGSKVVRPAPGVKLPADYITAILEKAGIKPANILKLHPKLKGVSAARIEKLVAECLQGYNRQKYEDCSYLLNFKIKKLGIKPVAVAAKPAVDTPPEWLRIYAEMDEGLVALIGSVRTEDVRQPEFWKARVRGCLDYQARDLLVHFGEERLREAARQIPPVYWEDMPGRTFDEKDDQTDNRRMTLEQVRKLIAGS
jgi:hypothetical protein